MIPSLRLVVYFALGTFLWVAGAALPELLTVALLFDVLLLFVAAMDLALSPRPRDFEITRVTDDRMNLGTANPVRLRVHSRANAPVVVTLRDEPPLGWPVVVSDSIPTSGLDKHKIGDKPVIAIGMKRAQRQANSDGALAAPIVARVQVEVEPNGESEGAYMVTPTRRGQWKFGALSARYTSRLGLWHRQFARMSTREEAQAVRVYPDVSHVRRYELRLREGRLRDIGLHAARLKGQGTEFESLREYSSDDNYKDINWKASARRGSLVSTQYEIERDQTVLIALDCGRMMTALAQFRDEKKDVQREAVRDEIASRFAAASDGKNGLRLAASGVRSSTSALSSAGATPLSKLDCAINATVLLAHVSASMGDSVGVLLFSDSVLGFVPPRKGRLQTGAIIEALYAAQPSLVEPDYGAAYNYILSRRVRRALVVTFTDLIDPDASRELLQASGALRRHHNALCVSINNRDVMDLASVMPQEASELYAKAMAQRMLTQRAAALEGLRRQGVGILDVDASELTIATVNRYLDLKSRAAM